MLASFPSNLASFDFAESTGPVHPASNPPMVRPFRQSTVPPQDHRRFRRPPQQDLRAIAQWLADPLKKQVIERLSQ
jgi:hypothetical protein